MFGKYVVVIAITLAAPSTNHALAHERPATVSTTDALVLPAMLINPPPPPPPDPILTEPCTPKEPSQLISFPPELAGIETNGTTELFLTLNPCGEVKRVRLVKTSGNDVLDKAAIENTSKWVFSPQSLQLSKGLGGFVKVPVTFMEAAKP